MNWTTGCPETESLKMRHFCSNIKSQSSEFESFSEEQELGKCLTGDIYIYVYINLSLLQEALLSLSLHHTSTQHWRQGDSLIQQRSVRNAVS